MSDVLFKTQHLNVTYFLEPKVYDVANYKTLSVEYSISVNNGPEVTMVNVRKSTDDDKFHSQTSAWVDEIGGTVAIMSLGTTFTDYICSYEIYCEYVRCIDEIVEMASKLKFESTEAAQ